MTKKKTIAASIISIVLSIFAFIFNILMCYLFLIVGAFGSLSETSNLLMVDIIICISVALTVLNVALFVLSIVMIVKLKKAEGLLNLKVFLIAYVIVELLVAVINIFAGIVVINSFAGWIYILFSLLYIFAGALVIADMSKQAKIAKNK